MSRRLGKHGLRPWGSTSRPRGKALSQGCRIPVSKTSFSKKQVLGGVLGKVKKWFDKERMHNNEVRSKHIVQRIKYELEYEQDKQLVLQQHNSQDFRQEILEACRKKLSFVSVHSTTGGAIQEKRKTDWIERTVLPSIGASARTNQYKHSKD